MKFTKEDFEDYLSTNYSPFEYEGLDKGEHVYLLSLDNQTSIAIRSSVRNDSVSAGVGKDSIRFWLESDGKPISSKMTRTHRTEGWQDRLSGKIDQLIVWRALAGDCKECQKPKSIFKAKTKENKGRPFTKCREHNDFVWLDEPIKTSEIYFSDESNLTDNGYKVASNSIDRWLEQGEKENDTDQAEDTKDTMAHNKGFTNDDMQSGSAGTISTDAIDSDVSIPGMRTVPEGPNEAQRSAIEADINCDLRVLAGPGSGKTFVIALRYEYLINNAVNPANILVCTFSKQASEEMAKRIQKLVSQANLETIITINALCSRLLTKWDSSSRWYNWKMPKEWQVKKVLEEIIGPIWQEKEKAGAREVITYINTTKTLGLTTNDSYQWFINVLGPQHGEWLYEIRSKFDAWLNQNRFITYADQLYLVEKKLQSDEAWRAGLQERFSHVIVDEAQDTTLIAMRILITISLEPGMNTVYEGEVK